ncbi:MAG: hypothetical protein U0414_10590 [Polyangiaceae bacterium]
MRRRSSSLSTGEAKRQPSVRPALSTLAVLSAVIASCGAREVAPPPAVPAAARPSVTTTPRAAAKDVPREAAANGPTFACRAALVSCLGEPCPGDQTCLHDGNFACGQSAALGKPCPAGTCERTGVELGTRVCLPEGCCDAEVRFPRDVPSCDEGEPHALIEIERGGAREAWLTCEDSAGGREVNEILFKDGTQLVYTFSAGYAERIGAPSAIRGFLRPAPGRIGDAIVAFGGGATLERNPYDQSRIVAARAHLLARTPGEEVSGAVVFADSGGEEEVVDFGTLAGERLPADALRSRSCGTDTEATYSCGALIGTSADPTWLFVQMDDETTLLDGFVAWSRPGGADVFLASRATRDMKGRIDLGAFRRLAHVDETQPGDAVVRVTIDE